MRHTILIATLSSVVASVLTTVVIGGSLFGAGTVSSANTSGEAVAAVSPGGLEGLLQGDADCDSDVGTRDSQGILRYVLQQPALSQDEPCPDIATVIPSGEGPPGPQGPAGPQGEQGPPGINLWATVRADGILTRGTATGATRVETGVYIVTFDQDVDECAPVANSGGYLSGLGLTFDATASTIAEPSFVGGENKVAVVLQNPVNRIDTDFHLIVVC